MSKSIVLSLCLLAFGILAFFSCGPAAEDRSVMLSRAKQVQDSIAYVIRSQMAEAESPGTLPIQTQTNIAPAQVVTHTNAAGETHTHAPGETHNH